MSIQKWKIYSIDAWGESCGDEGCDACGGLFDTDCASLNWTYNAWHPVDTRYVTAGASDGEWRQVFSEYVYRTQECSIEDTSGDGTCFEIRHAVSGEPFFFAELQTEGE